MANNISTTAVVNSQILNQPYGGNKTFTTSSSGTEAIQETYQLTGSVNLNLIPDGFSNMLVGLFINDATTFSSSIVIITGTDGATPIGTVLVPGSSAIIMGSGANKISLAATISGSITNASTASLQYSLLPA